MSDGTYRGAYVPKSLILIKFSNGAKGTFPFQWEDVFVIFFKEE